MNGRLWRRLLSRAWCPVMRHDWRYLVLHGRTPRSRVCVRCGRREYQIYAGWPWWWDVAPKGSTGHAGRPELGCSAMEIAFVQGAAWWEFRQTGGTMWGSDREVAEREAIRRERNGTLGVILDVHGPAGWEKGGGPHLFVCRD